MAKRTFLTLCQDAARACEIPGSGPSAVTGQTGIEGLIVRYAKSAIMRIERKQRLWKFMRVVDNSESITLVGGSDYDPNADWGLTDLREIDKESWRIYKTADGVAYESTLKFIDYDDWKVRFAVAFGNRTAQQPTWVTQLPSGDYRFDAPPDDTYTVTFDYIKATQPLTADGDYANIPESYEDAIIGAVMVTFGETQGMIGIRNEGQDLFDDAMLAMELEQLPDVKIAGPLHEQ